MRAGVVCALLLLVLESARARLLDQAVSLHGENRPKPSVFATLITSNQELPNYRPLM